MSNIYDEKVVRPFLDEDGRISQYPAKRSKQLEVLKYLATKLEPGRQYTEEEISIAIIDWHTFGDHCLLRRDMCDLGLIDRAANGTAYRRVMEG